MLVASLLSRTTRQSSFSTYYGGFSIAALQKQSSCSWLSRKNRRSRRFWNDARNAIQNVVAGDDHLNPRKRLERRYLYFALFALRYREILTEASANIPGYPSALGSKHAEQHKQWVEQARSELEAANLDNSSNVELRQQLQERLRPQVLEVFQAFSKVDASLGLSVNSNDTVDQDPHEFFETLDWEYLESIMKLEYQDLIKSAPSDDNADNNATFHQRKREALELLLEFHQAGTHNVGQPSSSDAFGVDTSSMLPDNLSSLRRYQILNLCRSTLVRRELGFSILCLKSTLSDAGRGVFIDGRAPAGSIVAFQPGDVWPKEHLMTSSPDVMEHFDDHGEKDDCHVSLRFDEYILDSRQSPVSVLAQQRAPFHNPWALGHMVNHGGPPNCQSTMLDFTTDMRLESHGWHVYLPNTYARLPTWRSQFFEAQNTLMHGLCLLAKRDVANEELLYDYRLQSEDTPAWYTVVDSDDQDEDQVVFFRDDWKKRS